MNTQDLAPTATDNRLPSNALLGSVLGRHFIGIWHSYGDVVWEVTSEPTECLDGSGRLFVWAKCIGRPPRPIGRRGPKPRARPPRTENVHFLPLRFLPNVKVSNAHGNEAQ